MADNFLHLPGMVIPVEHKEHWMEPQSLTETREGETYCESCGEEIPWHNNSCKLLKVAYKRRRRQCKWCSEEHYVGEEMYEHTTRNHPSELSAMGAQLSPRSS